MQLIKKCISGQLIKIFVFSFNAVFSHKTVSSKNQISTKVCNLQNTELLFLDYRWKNKFSKTPAFCPRQLGYWVQKNLTSQVSKFRAPQLGREILHSKSLFVEAWISPVSFRSLLDQFYSSPGMEKEEKGENKLFSIKNPSEIPEKIVGLSNEYSIIKTF